MRLSVHKASLGSRSVKGACFLREDADYTIVINSDLTDQEQALSFLHECLHAWHDDCNSERPVAEIETERHEELIQLLRLANV